MNKYQEKKNTRAIIFRLLLYDAKRLPFRTPFGVVGSPQGAFLSKSAKKNAPGRLQRTRGGFQLKNKNQGAPGRLLRFLRFFALFCAPGRLPSWGAFTPFFTVLPKVDPGTRQRLNTGGLHHTYRMTPQKRITR